jgi:membrane protein implicated in regulation of membrane protease activity
MIEFLESLQGPEKVFWYMAIPSSIVFLIMTVLTFMGMDSTDGLDADFEGDTEDSGGAFQLFTFRNLVSFITVFSWSGITCLQNSMSLTTSLIVSVLLGLVMVLILSSLFYFIGKLQVNYTPDIKHSIGKLGKVYLRIPKNGTGKVIVSYGGTNRIVDAMSKEYDCPTGSRVKITSEESGVLIVEPIS